jgi:hypothetical protein
MSTVVKNEFEISIIILDLPSDIWSNLKVEFNQKSGELVKVESLVFGGVEVIQT